MVKKYCFGLLSLSILFSEKVSDTVFKRRGSNELRLTFFNASLKAAKERPILGLGYKNFESKRLSIQIECFY